jgi:hypothetical protein
MVRHGPSCLEGPVSPTTGRQDAGPTTNDPNGRIRYGLVWRVRREIAAGNYDTPEKWEIAVGRLLQHIGQA